MTLTPHRTRVRAWLHAAPSFPHAFGHLAERTPDGMAHCFLGVGARVAMFAGAALTLRDRGGRGLMFEPTTIRCLYALLSEWYGIPVTEITVDVKQLPEPLRNRVQTAIDADHGLRPATAVNDELYDLDALGYPLWTLSDCGVPFDAIADALRWTLDLDRHLVAADTDQSEVDPTEQIAVLS